MCSTQRIHLESRRDTIVSGLLLAISLAFGAYFAVTSHQNAALFVASWLVLAYTNLIRAVTTFPDTTPIRLRFTSKPGLFAILLLVTSAAFAATEPATSYLALVWVSLFATLAMAVALRGPLLAHAKRRHP